MIPRKLLLRNFMCYREDVPPLEFDGIGIACLSGENGAGKSALLDALTWALWGEARLRSDDELIALGAQEMEVDFTFALDGQDYRVIRKRSKVKRGQSWLDFQVRHNGSWKVLTGATLRETQKTITSTLHMGYETFTNSAFLRQGRADEFTRKEPGRRKQVLADILGLDVYDTLEGGAKEKAKDIDGQLRVVEGQMTELERHANQREMYEQMVVVAEEKVHRVNESFNEAEQLFNEANERVTSLEFLKPQRDDYQKRRQSLQESRITVAQKIAENQRALEAAQKVVARRDEILAGVAQLRAAETERDRLGHLQAAYNTLVERRQGYIDSIKDERRRLEGELSKVENAVKHLQERANQRPRLEANIARLSEQLSSTSNLQSELAIARSKHSELVERSHTVGKLQVERSDLQKKIDLKHDSLVASREETKRRLRETDERLKKIEGSRTTLEQAVRERTQLEEERKKLEMLRQEEQFAREQIGALRAQCETIKLQGDDINKKLALLTDDTTICPLCGNELGDDGIAHIEAKYTEERQLLRQNYSGAKSQADESEERLQTMQEEIQQIERKYAALTNVIGRIARLEGELEEVEDLRRRHEEYRRTHDELNLQVVKGDYELPVRAELSRVDAQIRALGEPQGLQREMQRLSTRIKTLEGRTNELADLQAQLKFDQQEIERVEQDAPELYEQQGFITQFRQTLDMDDYAHDHRVALLRVEAELQELGYTPELHQSANAQCMDLSIWYREETSLQGAEYRMTEVQKRLGEDETLLQQYDNDITRLNDQLDELEEKLRMLAPAFRQRDEATQALREQRESLKVAQRDLIEKETGLKQALESAEKLKHCEKEHKRLTKRKGLFDELTKAFGKKGIQAMLIETAIPEIEREANQLLSQMTDNQMHLTFETQRGTKKGDTSETLQIKIADALGTRDYDAYSGGESFRVDFAIRIALAKLLARRAGARLETLVIDEGFGSQDARGRERLVEAITSVQRDFRHILVVTHIQELKDMFPVQIEVTKTDQGSLWTIA
ncbi:MAG: SMC family ATPase [Chloroflexi bacterium AL-W]|nr:SMC family ATPase [Chloroflexi bacterium AL-N1]NOK70269.1 SMC family ATPase [Chloroflexi bacterium AL-N10]NOK77806.1 SMC family ATPase [Chloroflexi bacterium AL-N5]NOK84815.1 SMC family ATPase [Chloroflexi bacterium AL-W]NOK92422.1 SMC family ATPase [Chloroflexi bacterium AL-N15]